MKSTIAITFGIAAAFLTGFASSRIHTVQAAADPGPTTFQLLGTSTNQTLGLYDGATRTIYVYQGVSEGSASRNCSYRLILGRVGDRIRRENCDIGSLQ